MNTRAGQVGLSLGLVLGFGLGLALSPALPLGAEEFSFHEPGARAAGMGGAFTARADDITAIFYNPAGLAFLGGWRLKTNETFGSRTMDATRSDTGLTFPSDPQELRGSHFVAWRPARGVSVGLGTYSPYNLDSRWPRTWTGEDVSLAAKLNAQTFRTAVAVEPLKGLAFSAALDLVSMSVRWEHKIPFDLEKYPLSQPTKVLSFHQLRGHGVSFAAGLLWKVLPGLQIGARYQKSVAIDLSGTNGFIFDSGSLVDTLPDPVRPFRTLADFLDLFYADQAVTARMTLPREVACGVAVTPIRNLSFSFDLQWDRWSEFGPWTFTSVLEGDDLNPEFTPLYRDFYGIEPNYGVQGPDLALKDSKKIKAGLEYRAGRWFAVRAGFARHESSVEAAGRTPLYPDPGFKIYSVGAGYEGPLFSIWDTDRAVSLLTLDLFVRYATADAATSTVSGLDLIYGAKRWVAGIGVGFIF